MTRVTEFLKSVRSEVSHVVWPTRQMTWLYTAIVIVVSVLIAYYLNLFDVIFGDLLGLLV